MTTTSLTYQPSLDGVPYDPAASGGSVERLRLFEQASGRAGEPVVSVGPAERVAPSLYRFDFTEPTPGLYLVEIVWREDATSPPNVDADQVVAVPIVNRPPWQLLTGGDLAVALGGDRYPRAVLDQAAATISGLVEGYTRGRSVRVVPPRDLVAVATTAALRLASNLPQHTSVGTDGQNVAGSFRGWTLTEQAVLNRYRQRTA